MCFDNLASKGVAVEKEAPSPCSHGLLAAGTVVGLRVVVLGSGLWTPQTCFDDVEAWLRHGHGQQPVFDVACQLQSTSPKH